MLLFVLKFNKSIICFCFYLTQSLLDLWCDIQVGANREGNPDGQSGDGKDGQTYLQKQVKERAFLCLEVRLDIRIEPTMP